MTNQDVQRIGFACKYMHPDQTQKKKVLEEIQRPLTEKCTTITWLNRQTRDVAEQVFTKTNQQVVDALESMGARAVGLTADVFECTQDKPDLGFVGTVMNVNEHLVNKILEEGSIPVIAPLGQDGNEVLNINADIATVELVKTINPYKVIFLSDIGGIFNKSDQLIENINLVLEYEDLMAQEWLHSGMKLKLEQIKELLSHLPKTSSVSITKPINLPKELFTDSGSGTLIKHGYKVNKHELPDTKVIFWRNSKLNFANKVLLVKSLEERPHKDWLRRISECQDEKVLLSLIHI